MMNLVVKDEDIFKYLKENDVILKQKNMGNLALDLDKYLSHSVDFRKIPKVEPLQGINLLKENNLIDVSNDSSFEVQQTDVQYLLFKCYKIKSPNFKGLIFFYWIILRCQP